MKTRYVFILALVLAGCTTAPRPAALNAEQAATFARRLANEKAQTLYNCQPFRYGPAAQFVEGYWVWHDRRGHGNADIEATVEFAADGTKPSVDLGLLYSMPLW